MCVPTLPPISVSQGRFAVPRLGSRIRVCVAPLGDRLRSMAKSCLRPMVQLPGVSRKASVSLGNVDTQDATSIVNRPRPPMLHSVRWQVRQTLQQKIV